VRARPEAGSQGPIGSRHRERRHARQRGITLVEVMVALVVLAVGLLGAFSLQGAAKRASLEAVQRSTATALAQDIVERMRANAGELATYTNFGLGRSLDGATLANVDCAAGCNPAELALHDLAQWEQALAGVTEQRGGVLLGGLIEPTACVSGPDGGSGVYLVAIAWRGLARLSDPAIHPCGAGSGRYDADDGEPDVHRRLLLLETYIARPL
jgi:type IV pilus assembly protein PilV